MTDTGANAQHAHNNTRGYKLYKYSFIVKDFTPSNTYPSEVKNGKVYVNLSTFDERTAFLADLKAQNVRAHESLYEYYVSVNKHVNGTDALTFSGLVTYLKNLVSLNEDTKNLRNCFKVLNDNMGYKVIVSSFKLVKYLNSDKLFVSYKRNKGTRTVRTTTFRDNTQQQHQQNQQ